MGSTTWQGMSGNGSATRMTQIITPPARRETRLVRKPANIKSCGEVRGTSLQRICDLRVGTLIYHQPQIMTRLRIETSTVGSGVQRVRRTLFPGHAGSY